MNCYLCGQTELQLCSPLVVAQSRLEHDLTIDMCSKALTATNFPVGSSNDCIAVKLFIAGKAVVPSVDFPYLPTWKSENGRKLLTFCTAASVSNDTTAAGAHSGLVTHEMCALQLFQSRMTRHK